MPKFLGFEHMQNTRKKLGLLFIGLGLLVLILIIYFGFLRRATLPEIEAPIKGEIPQLPVTEEIGTTTPGDKPRNRQQYDISQEKAHQLNANDLAKMAMSFSERFGSFSNQSNYGNFTDLKIFMTDDLKTWVDTYVEKLRLETKSDSGYYGLVTKALTTEIKSFDDSAGTAQIIVTTERRESTEKINGGEPYQQNIDLRFQKVNGEWLVNEVYWDK